MMNEMISVEENVDLNEGVVKVVKNSKAIVNKEINKEQNTKKTLPETETNNYTTFYMRYEMD